MIVGFTGSMGSGKSTAIRFFRDRLYLSNDRTTADLVKFAGPLYAMQEHIYRLIAPVHRRPEGFTKDRKLLQWLGTDWGRDTISKTLWVDLWKQAVKESDADSVFCDDVRFDNEADALHSVGGYIVKIVRQASMNFAEGGEGIKNHASEAGVSQKLIDFSILNTGSIKDFNEQLNQVFEQIIAREEQKKKGIDNGV